MIALTGILLALAAAPEAWAQDPQAPQAQAQDAEHSPLVIACKEIKALSPGSFITPVVQCFTGTRGIVPGVARAFLHNTQQYYTAFAGALLTLGVVLFGIKLALGDVQRPKGDTFMLIFKVAAIAYFMAEAPHIYDLMLGALADLADKVSRAISGATRAISASHHTPLFCDVPDTGVALGSAMWGRWDCMFGKLGSLGSFLFYLAITNGFGFLILQVGVYFLFAFFFTLARFVHIYLMAVLGFSFVFCLGYLLVPLLLFRDTFSHFQKWLNICLGYLLTPVLMFAYMGMMLVAFDLAVFSGDFSLWHQVAPNIPPTEDNFAQAILHKKEVSKSMMVVQIGPPIGGAKATDPGAAAIPPANPEDQGSIGKKWEDKGIREEVYMNNRPRNSLDIAFEKISTLDIKWLAANAQKTPEKYESDLLIALSTASLLCYIMYSLLSYIPDLAGEIVSQGNQSMTRSLSKSPVFGEQAARTTMGQVAQTGEKMASKMGDAIKNMASRRK